MHLQDAADVFSRAFDILQLIEHPTFAVQQFVDALFQRVGRLVDASDAFQAAFQLILAFPDLRLDRRGQSLDPGFGLAVEDFKKPPHLIGDFVERTLRDLSLFLRQQGEGRAHVRGAPAFQTIDFPELDRQRKSGRIAEFEAMFDDEFSVDGDEHLHDFADDRFRSFQAAP